LLPQLAPLLASAATSRLLAIALGVGLVALFVLQAVLLWTRWGQARPVAKCVFLSLLAHVLLIVYAWSTHVLFNSPGSWSGNSTVRVRLADATDEIDAAMLVGEMPAEISQEGTDAGTAATVPAASDDQPPVEATAPVPELIAPPVPPAPAPPTPQEVAQETPPAPAEQPEPAEVPLKTADPAKPAPSDVAAAPPEARAPAEAAGESTAEPPEQFTAAPTAEPRRVGDGAAVPEALRARIVADRLKIAQQFGATPSTEAAVAAALDWLARVQSADGRWDADLFGAGRETRTLGHDRQGAGAKADTGISGLALLAFLGNGETHLSGKHREVVQRGLEFLLASQRADGFLAGEAEFFASTYCHGMATLALSEAYALSGDERLLPGLKAALQYTIQSQHAAGGWRYKPYDAGDMSQFGWQVMSLKSAEVGGLPIPQATRGRMVRFLRACSSGSRSGLAGYRPGDRVSRPMTAEALVCRYFLAAENDPAALAEAAAYIGEERPGAGQPNYYYWYYGTLAMFQRQGDDWTRWNAAMQAELLGRQRLDGELAGSWDADDQWGGYGGRAYSTALATLSLEVYYRYLPIYGNNDPRDRLTDRPLQPLPR
jgi:outer membrane biosynthesis protein TonB